MNSNSQLSKQQPRRYCRQELVLVAATTGLAPAGTSLADQLPEAAYGATTKVLGFVI